MRALLAIALVACGSAPVAVIKQPNTHQACMRAIRCQVFAEHEYTACVNCLEHVDQALLAKLRAEYGDLPPLEQIDCDTLWNVCNDTTNVARCVHEKWWGA